MRALIILLVCATPVMSQQIQVPETVHGKPCKFVTITATSEGEVKWYPLDNGLDFVPAHLLANKKTIVVMAKQGGIYRILAYTAKGDVPSDPVICQVIISADIPDPKPDPKPEPTGFEAKLKEAYASDSGKAKLATLVEVWKQSDKLIHFKELKTSNELWKALKVVESGVLADGDLPATRKAIWDEVLRQFPENYFLTSLQRDSVSVVITKMVAIMEKLP